ncbi:hypothetical protein GCM10009676_15860 [Prauserella halophila]|uniref:ArsR family transcriptional regulator n=1 Tax=Prauserella halophila TaxID=185641 RepID=A0ABP4GSH6_9PSEU|nr:hypothetical protein [Prauserella halophila]
MSFQAVSQHLKVLGDAGPVTRSKEAQRRPVHLDPEVFDLMSIWIEIVREFDAEPEQVFHAHVDPEPYRRWVGPRSLHSWDLAKALGHEPDLGQERCAPALEGMRAIEGLLRDGGQFGPPCRCPTTHPLRTG